MARIAAASLLALLGGAVSAAAAPPRADRPNFVFFLTDDQDQMLGGSFPAVNGSTPMPAAQRELVQKGATAQRWFIHTPICCPSRSELVTGRYFHNIKRAGECPNPPAARPSGCCMHVDTDLVNNNTVARLLQERGGYTVGLFGKYLNLCPEKAPPGFDAYFANGGGDYFSPTFFVQGVEGFDDGVWHGTEDNYTTAVVGNVSLAWIRRAADQGKPFFAYIAPKAAHEPFTPAKWYAEYWDPSWPATEPRPVSWNCSAESRSDHHYTIRTEPMLSEGASEKITSVFKDRWRTLMSVDDVISDTVALVEELGLTDSTYFFFSSDHGFQLGEFNLPFDKRHAYEFDIRIHLVVKGPGIAAGSEFSEMGTQVDFAPTWLDMAGVPYADAGFDGKSFLPFLVAAGSAGDAPASVQAAVSRRAGGVEAYRGGWRDSVFIEYYYNDNNTKCIPNCYNIEDPSNNFIAVRHGGGKFGETLYAEYQTAQSGETVFDDVDFHEYYNITADPWQMDNLYNGTDETTLRSLHDKLRAWYACAGESCP